MNERHLSQMEFVSHQHQDIKRRRKVFPLVKAEVELLIKKYSRFIQKISSLLRKYSISFFSSLQWRSSAFSFLNKVDLRFHIRTFLPINDAQIYALKRKITSLSIGIADHRTLDARKHTRTEQKHCFCFFFLHLSLLIEYFCLLSVRAETLFDDFHLFFVWRGFYIKTVEYSMIAAIHLFLLFLLLLFIQTCNHYSF